jgi:hypothetical protein
MRDRLEQLGLVLEVVIGRGGADAGLAGDGAQRQGGGAFGFEDTARSVHEGARQVAVVIGPSLSVSSFSHRPAIKLYPNAVKMDVDTVQIGAI